MDSAMHVVIVNGDDGTERYELRRGDERIGFSDAKEENGKVFLPYVFVEPEHRRMDNAKNIVRHQLLDLRAKGKKVVPVCPYVVAFIRRYPEFADLVAE